jgi:hypothetical protein
MRAASASCLSDWMRTRIMCYAVISSPSEWTVAQTGRQKQIVNGSGGVPL